MADSSGTTLMDLITADPSTASASASTTTSSSASTQPAQSSGYAASPPKSSSGGLPTALGKPAGEKRSKRAALMQIQNDTISAAKAALNPVRTNINILPQKHKHKQKKPVSYAQLARRIHEVAAASDQNRKVPRSS